VIPSVSVPDSPLTDAQLAFLIPAVAKGNELSGRNVMLALTELRDHRVAAARRAAASELREIA
jgi:hypothetical protein